MYLKNTLLLLLSASVAFAQSLPAKQQASLPLPVGLKIDGKSTEWNDRLQAHNNATNISYTLANNDTSLYIIIQANYKEAIRKITTNGINILISPSGKKDDAGAVAIIYPVYEGNKKPVISLNNIPQIVNGTPASVMQADSFMNANNRHLTDMVKLIKIGGDTLSVYNDQGVRSAGLFNNKMEYTCELQIPLKMLKLSIAATPQFTYRITVPALHFNDYPGVSRSRGADGVMTVYVSPGTKMPGRDELASYNSSTDFWGEYTLAKKP